MNQRLLNLKEAAEYFGISPANLRNRIYRKQIGKEAGMFKLGKLTYFDKVKLDNYIESLTDEEVDTL